MKETEQMTLDLFAPQPIRQKNIKSIPGQMTLDLFSETIINQSINKITRIKRNCIVAAGKELAKMLTSSSTIKTKVLQDLMSAVYEGTDAQGKWVWKNSYEALEVGLVLYLRQMGSSLLTSDHNETLEKLIKIEASLPTHTRRSEDQIALQQFSTPLPLSFIVAIAANMTTTDLVLEPSSGNGLLAIWSEIAGAKLILNEISKSRRDNLIELFPDAPVSEHNGEQIDDLLDKNLKPTVVLINPPFSSSPKIVKRNPMATWKHLTSAIHRLQPGGRLVAITADWFSPHNPDWTDYFARLRKFGFVAFSAGIEGRAYRKHGTMIDTRLTIIEREKRFDFGEIIDEKLTLQELLKEIQLYLPRYQAEETTDNSEEKSQNKISTPSFTLISVQTKTTSQPFDIPLTWKDIIDVEYSSIQTENNKILGEEIYESYQPQTMKIHKAQSHPSPLVESAAMASVKPPLPSYRPKLPRRIVEEG